MHSAIHTGLDSTSNQTDGSIPSSSRKFPTCEQAPDVLVQHFGSVTILWPRTPDAKVWFDQHVDTRQTWGVGTVCEPRYVEPIVAGLIDAGFDVVRSS